MRAGASVVAGPLVMDAEFLVVGRPARLQRDGEPAVAVAQRGRAEVGDDRLADPVVIRLDPVAVRRPPRGPNQSPGPQQREGRPLVTLAAEALPGNRRTDRAARDGDDLQQPTGVVGQAEDARPEHLVERDRALTYFGPRQFGDEQRVAPRLARDRTGAPLGIPAHNTEHVAG